MNKLMNSINFAKPDDVPDRVKLLDEFCREYNIKKVWASFSSFPNTRELCGHVYFEADSVTTGKGIASAMMCLLAPDVFDDDEEVVLKNDFIVIPIAPDSASDMLRNINNVGEKIYLIYTEERGVLIG